MRNSPKGRSISPALDADRGWTDPGMEGGQKGRIDSFSPRRAVDVTERWTSRDTLPSPLLAVRGGIGRFRQKRVPSGSV